MTYDPAQDRELKGIGQALGIVARFGSETIREAIARCERGNATSRQQQIVALLLRARLGDDL